jgi:type II secretory pathway component PulF
MPLFLCRVSDGQGRVEEFLREAVSEEPLVRELSARDLFVLSVQELQQGVSPEQRERRFPRKVVGDLTDLLSLMLGSGLSLKDSLEIAQTVFSRGPGNALVVHLLERIRKGSTFALALENTGGSFPAVYRGMVKIGERIGSLDQVFTRLSAYLKDEKKLGERFSAALLYPAIVLGVAFVSALLVVFILFPRLREIFSQLGPGMGERVETLMRSLNTAFVVIGIVIVLAVGSLLFTARARRRGGALALRIDALILRIPLASTFLMDRELLNFAFAMETLTAAGVSVEEALSEGAGAIANKALAAAVSGVRDRVLKGEPLSSAFSHDSLFPERIPRWVGVGERVGHVEKVFGQLRAFYQQEVEKWINRLMTLIEPALIVAMGIMIVLFVVLFIIPIFSLYGNIL